MQIDWKQIVRAQLAPLRLPPERELEIVEELALHLEAAYETALARGLAEAAARAHALAQLNDWPLFESELARAETPSRGLPSALATETWIEQIGGLRMESLWRDLGYGWRALRKQPGFTLLAVLTLALGIGAHTALFSLVHAVLLRPLPFAEQERLIVAWKQDTTANNPFVELSVAEFKDWEAQSRSFASLAVLPTTVYGYGYVMTGRGETVQLESARVSGRFFELLGVKPALGRVFDDSHDQVHAPKVMVLSDQLWRARFAADPNVVGQTVTLSEQSFTVLGVMPPQFEFPQGADCWTPVRATMNARTVAARGAVFLQAIGRLKAGVTLAQAEAELNTIIARLAEQYPQTKATGQRAVITPLTEHLFGNARLALWLLLGATGVLLLIAAVNLAHLLLARATARRKEFAVRAALGAGRWQIVRQLLTESCALALCGGAVGVVLAYWLLEVLVTLAPADIPRVEDVRLNLPVLLFSLGVTLATALVFGLFPALVATKFNLNEALNEDSGKLAGGRTGQRFRSALLVAEVALTIVLLAGASLILRSFVNLSRVRLGFDPQNVLTMQLRLTGAKYTQPAARREFFRQLIERLEAQPGVVAASGVLIRPLEGTVGWDTPFLLEGQSATEAQRNAVPNFEAVTPHYFRTLGIPLKAGRVFNEHDTDQSQPVAIISETMAQALFPPGVEPVGQRLRSALDPEDTWRTIVGIAGAVRYRELQGVRWDLYVPDAQSRVNLNHFAVRTATDPAGFLPLVRRELAALDPQQVATSVATLEQLLAQNLARPRFNAALLNWLAGLAVLLAALGIYGTLTYTVAQRTNELGVRLALGAQPRDILRLIIGQGLALTLLGVGLGLLAAFGLTRWLANLLFGVSATDPLTFAGIALLLLLVALVACYLPARRATRVDPLIALRSE